jgi:hypothetical protein
MHPHHNYFKEHKGNHNIFVETGSCKGDGIDLAMQADYRRIFSMDIDGANVAHCQERFGLIPDDENKQPARNGHISVTCADSAIGLLKMMKYVNEPALIWLDAHSQLFDDEPVTENPFPLLKELEQLRKHPIRSHTILIDDILILTHPDVTGWNKETIENALLMINPAYKLTYLPNPVVNNILMAHV